MEPDCAANSEAGGKNSPDAGVYVVDIRDLENPELVGFIPHSQDSRPGEGLQATEITTKSFSGTMLISNNEQCGKNGKGGVSLYDVSDPFKPRKLSEHFGDRNRSDTNTIHSAFAWDVGDKAYVVMTDNEEATDVDILDITNPRRPRFIADLDLAVLCGTPEDPIDQPDIGLTETFLHDMVVKQIDGEWVMLLAYWDGGYVRLNVDDPANPVCLDDTDFTNPDPELLEIVAVCTTHEAFHLMFGIPIPAEYSYPEDIEIGTIGERIEVDSVFDGWGLRPSVRRGHGRGARHLRGPGGSRSGVRVRFRRPLGARGGGRSTGSDPGLPVLLLGWHPGHSDPVLGPGRQHHMRARRGRELSRPGGQRLLGSGDLRR